MLTRRTVIAGLAVAVAVPSQAVASRSAESAAALGDTLLREAALQPRPPAYLFSPANLHATIGLAALGSSQGNSSALARNMRRDRLALERTAPGLTLAYALWAARGARIGQRWQSLARSAAAPRTGTLDFEASDAAAAINAWAHQATQGAIPHLVDRIDPAARLVLAGAAHFAGRWTVQFPPAATSPLPFRRLDGTTATVPTMQALLSVPYGADALGHAVHLAYRNTRLSMWVACARRPENSAAFLDMLAAKGTGVWLRSLSMRTGDTVVRMPRLRFSGGGDMLPLLRRTRWGAVLSEGAPAILGRPAPIAEVIHRGSIVIDEQGTVAAAATAATGMRSMPTTALFEADRPYVFVLGLAQPWLPLFMGYVGDASAV